MAPPSGPRKATVQVAIFHLLVVPLLLGHLGQELPLHLRAAELFLRLGLIRRTMVAGGQHDRPMRRHESRGVYPGGCIAVAQALAVRWLICL
jgi:hypothetical protein